MGKGRKKDKGGGGGGRRRHPRAAAGRGWEPAELSTLRSQVAAFHLTVRNIIGDGNCLFASFADQLWDEQQRHPELRASAVACMRAHADHFSLFLLEEDLEEFGCKDFAGYCDAMAKPTVWGGNSELQALVNLHSRNVAVHRAGEKPLVLSPLEGAARARNLCALPRRKPPILRRTMRAA